MEKCCCCGAPTQLYVNEAPLCIACSDKHDALAKRNRDDVERARWMSEIAERMKSEAIRMREVPRTKKAGT